MAPFVCKKYPSKMVSFGLFYSTLSSLARHCLMQEAVIFLPAHPASYTHNLVSRMQSFNFGGSQDAMILHDFSMKIVFRTHISLQ